MDYNNGLEKILRQLLVSGNLSEEERKDVLIALELVERKNKSDFYKAFIISIKYIYDFFA